MASVPQLAFKVSPEASKKERGKKKKSLKSKERKEKKEKQREAILQQRDCVCIYILYVQRTVHTHSHYGEEVQIQ